MATSTDVFHLVKSLSPRERSAFLRNHHARSGRKGAKYMKLFALLEKQNRYDEPQLRRALQMPETGSAFSVLKNYLYNELLRSLSEASEAQSTTARIRQLENEGELLIRKELFRQAFSRLRAAYSLAFRNEHYFQAQEIFNSLLKLHVQTASAPIRKWIRSLLPPQELNARAREIMEVNTLLVELAAVARGNATKSDRRWLQNLPKNEKWRRIFEPGALITLTAQFNAFSLRGTRFSLLGQSREAYRVRGELHSLFLAHPHFIPDRLNAYAGNLFNLMSSGLRIGDLDTAERCLKSLKDIPRRNARHADAHLLQRIRLRVLNGTLYLHFHGLPGPSPGQLLPEIKQLEAIAPAISPEHAFVLMFNAVMLCLELENFPEASRFLRKLETEFPQDRRQDIRDVLRLVEPALLLRRNELDLMEYKLRGHRRYFDQAGEGFEAECMLLGLMEKLAASPDRREAEELVAFTSKDIAALLLPTSELTYERRWCLSRIMGLLEG